VQTRVNTNLTTPSWNSYWLLQDANYNVIGVVNSSGTLVERYEYSAYASLQCHSRPHLKERAGATRKPPPLLPCSPS
jgi:hypothetical protein